MLTMYGCSSNSYNETPTMREIAPAELNAKGLKVLSDLDIMPSPNYKWRSGVADQINNTDITYGYDYCGGYTYGYSLLARGAIINSYFEEFKLSCNHYLSPKEREKKVQRLEANGSSSTSNYFLTRLGEEFEEKVKELSTEFMCVEIKENENYKYFDWRNDNRFAGEVFLTELKKRNIDRDKDCPIIYEEYMFAEQVDASQEKCIKMGFSLDTPDMSNCVLQLVANDTSSSSTTTVVVEGGSSDSAITDELRKMNKRENKIYYENMMQRGMDILNCTTWPNC